MSVSRAWEPAFPPDEAGYWTVQVPAQERLARDTFRLRLPIAELASKIRPGQFVMVRLAGADDPLLGRAFALYDVVRDRTGRPEAVDIVYLVRGKLTRRLAQAPAGMRLDIWGPLGNGFVLPETARRVLMVAGGIGCTPFLAVARHLRQSEDAAAGPPEAATPPRRIVYCYGVRSRAFLVDPAPLRELGAEVHLASEDGSVGHRGLITDTVASCVAEIPFDLVLTCGPEPMMESVAQIAERAGVPCQVSLETPMACGIGACFSCVARIRQDDGSWDYKRTCVEGPVFDARRVVWKEG